jgi:hypothetical protein
LTDPVPFTFDACADSEACRARIRPLLAPGSTWSEVHCGRCGRQGIVTHAELATVPAPAPDALLAPTQVEPAEPAEPKSESEPDSVSDETPQAPKGARS